MRPYELQYWAYNPDDETTNVLRRKDVLVSDETIKAMLGSEKRQFYSFIIKDGEDFILAADLVHDLTRQFK